MYGIGKSQEPFGALRGEPALLSTGKVGEAPTSPSWLLNQGGKDVGTAVMLPHTREQEGYGLAVVLQDTNLVVHCQEVTPVSLIKEGQQHLLQEDTSRGKE